MYVGRRMTPNPITASPDTSHSKAVKLMRDNKIHSLPVVDNGKLVGVVVEEDLLSSQPSPATTLSIYEIYSLLDKLTLRSIMSSPVYTVEEDCPLEEAALIMLDKEISCLPVMQGSRLVGIITETDIFRALVDVLGGEEEGQVLSVKLENKPGALATVTNAVAQAGGNIQNLVTFRDADDAAGEIYIKEVGADPEALKRLITEKADADLLSIAPAKRWQPVEFGGKK